MSSGPHQGFFEDITNEVSRIAINADTYMTIPISR